MDRSGWGIEPGSVQFAGFSGIWIIAAGPPLLLRAREYQLRIYGICLYQFGDRAFALTSEYLAIFYLPTLCGDWQLPVLMGLQDDPSNFMSP